MRMCTGTLAAAALRFRDMRRLFRIPNRYAVGPGAAGGAGGIS